jgi:hypothetical protein
VSQTVNRDYGVEHTQRVTVMDENCQCNDGTSKDLPHPAHSAQSHSRRAMSSAPGTTSNFKAHSETALGHSSVCVAHCGRACGQAPVPVQVRALARNFPSSTSVGGGDVAGAEVETVRESLVTKS